MNKSKLLTMLRQLFRFLGLEVRFSNKKTNFNERLEYVLCDKEINKVIDIGSNRGQFLRLISSLGYSGDVHCFEPLPWAITSFEISNFEDYFSKITFHQVALSDTRKVAAFHVTAEDTSSSLFASKYIAEKSQGRGAMVDTIQVQCDKLDNFVDLVNVNDRILLKIDVQGGELDLLKGGGKFLGVVDVVLIEVSTIELYAGQGVFDQVILHLAQMGFRLWDMHDSFRDEHTGSLLQADLILVR